MKTCDFSLLSIEVLSGCQEHFQRIWIRIIAKNSMKFRQAILIVTSFSQGIEKDRKSVAEILDNSDEHYIYQKIDIHQILAVQGIGKADCDHGAHLMLVICESHFLHHSTIVFSSFSSTHFCMCYPCNLRLCTLIQVHILSQIVLFREVDIQR